MTRPFVIRSAKINIGLIALFRADVTLKAIREAWDHQVHNFELHTLEKIAKALGRSICDLIKEEDSAPLP